MQSNHCYQIQVETLREKIARMEGIVRQRTNASISSGCKLLDRILPEDGFPCGTLVEWLAAGDGVGATTLAMLAAAQACRQGGALVVLDRSGEFHPPAAVQLGIESSRLIVIHTHSKADHYWALDQSVRCPAVAAVLAWPEAMRDKLDGRTFRRLQLAVEKGGGLGLLIRPEAAQHQPSWADVRLLVESLPTVSGRKRRLQNRVCFVAEAGPT